MTDFSDMTPEQIDALVAERVMGWEWFPGRLDTPIEPGAEPGWCRTDEDGLRLYVSGEWSPSTSIADAWEVVDRMLELGWLCHLDPATDMSGQYQASMHRPDEYGAGERHGEGLAPLAICIAALRALGDD